MVQPNWAHALASAIRSQRELAHFLETEIPKLDYPILLPLKWAQKIKERGPDSPLWRQFVPDEKESDAQGLDDPIADATHSPVPMIVHRYKNRCLFLPTQHCPIICRYCFRKNELYGPHLAFGRQTQEAMDYIKKHPEIEEVIFSGGDPLILSNNKLKTYLADLSQIPTVRYVRFHSRTPVILPERIDDELLSILSNYSKKFVKVSLVIHCNHSDEASLELKEACQKLSAIGVQMLSQSVLLKGVNDKIEALTELFQTFVQYNITPYYLHHPDDAKGAQHFKLQLFEGQKLVRQLRQRLPGWAIPRYTIEMPNGAGKVNATNELNQNFNDHLDDAEL